MSRLLGILVVGVAVLASALAASRYLAYSAIDARQEEREREARAVMRDEAVRVTYSQNLPFDPREEGALVRGAEELFVGRVEGVVGHEDNDPVHFFESWAPQTQFRVEVLDVIKDASGGPPEAGATAVVNQLGVPPEGVEARIRLANDYEERVIPAEMLEPGKAYVFATEHEAREGWHAIRVDPFGPMVFGDGFDRADGRYADRLKDVR